MTHSWQVRIATAPAVPALAWIARIRDGVVDVTCGSSVRKENDAFFEGTWAGPATLTALPEATTVFGSGMVVRGSDLCFINPSHHLEGIYSARVGTELVLSNSFVAVLAATDLELDATFDYPSLFAAASALCWLVDDVSADGTARLLGTQVSIPTQAEPITLQYVENLTVNHDLSVAEARKPRESEFASFADYSRRITNALASAFSNAAPYEPVVALSSGYDSTAVAAVAAQVGCRTAVGFETSRLMKDGADDDTGTRTATLLDLRFDLFDRLAYLHADDIAEAEFMASGTSGEDIIFRAFEPAIRRKCLLTGYWAGTQWAMSHSGDWRHIAPTSTAGAGLGEFRLRADFYHLPLPVFAAAQPVGTKGLLDRAEMEPYRVGGHYDRPIPRRLAEDAGIPRGSFGVTKRAANVLYQHDGLDAFSPASLESIKRFAAAEGRPLSFQRRARTSRLRRGTIKLAERLHLAPLVDPLRRRRLSLVHFQPDFGNLVLRWAVSVVRPRYAAVVGIRR